MCGRGWGRGTGDEKMFAGANIAGKRQQRKCDGGGKDGKMEERGTLNQGGAGGRRKGRGGNNAKR